MNLIPIKGSGAGKGGSGEVRVPREAEDSLQSRAYARFVDLLSEGPIDGFCNEAGQLLQDAAFTNSSFATTNGTITFASADYVIAADGVVTHRKLPGGLTEPLIDPTLAGAGYPSCYHAGQLPRPKCLITGGSTDGYKGVEAEVFVATYPKTTAERTLLQTAFPTLTDVELPLYPEGRVRGIYAGSTVTNTTGKDYAPGSSVTLIPPTAVGQALYFDDRPLVEAYDLTPNFSDVQFYYRLGYEDQTVMPGFEQVEEVIDVSNAGEDIAYDPDGATGWAQTIENKEYDYLIININWPSGLYKRNLENGDVVEHASVLRISQRYKQEGAGSFSNWLPFGDGQIDEDEILFVGASYRVAGKTMSAYERSIQGHLAKDELGKRYTWEIRVVRASKDDDDTTIPNSDKTQRVSGFRVGQLTGITDSKLTYPFCAVVGVKINAEQFNRLPTRGYRVRLVRVQVPSNYVPPGTPIDTYSETGVFQSRRFTSYPQYNRINDGTLVTDTNSDPVDQLWDGTFYESWTNNPAWVAYGICTNTRWGLGRYLSSANKWWFYKIGRYCDELVDTGYDATTGSYSVQEPRFTFNAYFQTREEAFRILRDVSSTFAGYVYFGGGQIIPVHDYKRTARMHFTPANVENGLFNYKGTTRKVRHTVAVVTFNDPAIKYKQSPVYYEDVEGLLRYGVQFLEKAAFGCASRGQARRLSKRLIRQEVSNTDAVSFVAGLQASVLRPGDVFAIYDPTRSGYKFGGRLLGTRKDDSNNYFLITDRKIDRDQLSVNPNDYSVTLHCPSAQWSEEDLQAKAEAGGVTLEDVDKLMQSQFVSFPVASFDIDEDRRTIIGIVGLLPESIGPGTVWGLKESSFAPQYFATLGIEELEKGKFAVSGIEYQEALYDEVDSDAPYGEEPISPDLTRWKETTCPRDLQITVVTSTIDGARRFTMHVSWAKPLRGFAVAYEVHIKEGLGNYQFKTKTNEFSAAFDVTPNQTYGALVYAISITGARSMPIEGLLTVVDDDIYYNNELISGLEIRGQGNDNKFYTGDLDVDWRVNWSEALSNFEALTGTVPLLPPPIKEYAVSVVNPSGGELMSENVTQTEFKLTVDRNRQLVSGPYRDLVIKVVARSHSGVISKPTQLRFQNDKPSVPIGVEVLDTQTGGVQVRFPASSNNDFAGFRVWMSITTSFTPSVGNLVYEGSATITPVLSIVGAAAETTYYLRYAEFDLLSNGVLDCTISNETSKAVTVLAEQAKLSVFDFLARS